LSQQLKAVAAWDGKESKRNAATANASTLNFITISFLSKSLRGIARHTSAVLLMGKEFLLNPKIVFEIEYGTSIAEASSEFAKGRGDDRTGPWTQLLFGLCNSL
jgi:hypothetical protein